MIRPRQRRDRDGKAYTVFQVDIEFPDRRYNRTLPRGTTKRQAEAFEARVKYLHRTGDLEMLERGRETLTEFAAEWWSLYAGANLARSTLARYAEVWNAHVLPRIGEMTLRELTPETVARFRSDLERAGVGAATVRKALSMLQGMLERAVEWQRIPANPVKAVRKPPAGRERDVVIVTPEQVEALRRHVLAEDVEGRGHRDATLISVLAYAALRPWSEAVHLVAGDVRDRTLQAYASKTARSRRRPRTIDLLGPLRQDIAEWMMASGRPGPKTLLFPAHDGPWQDDDVRNWRRRVWKPAIAAAGLDPAMVPYDLRHSFASLRLHEMGLDGSLSFPDIAEQMGHTVKVLSDTYSHVMRELKGTERVPAEEQIRRARESVWGARRAV